MKLSCAFAPRCDVIENTKLAESLGYDKAFFADSPALYGDVFIAMARAAEATERIGIGTAVLIPSLRHVMTTAAAIATLEQIAPGRLTIAVGTGFTGRRMFGRRALSWRTTERYVRDLKGLLRGFEVEVDGHVTRMFQPPGFGPERPITTPIWVAANGAKGLAVADEVGDGLLCAAVVPEGARNAAVLCFGTVLAPGEDWADDRVIDAIGPAIAMAYHGAYDTAGDAVDALPGGKGWREEIEAIPEPVRHLYVHENHAVSMTDRDRRHVSPALGAGMTFSGTAEQLREKLNALESRGVSELVFFPLGSDLPGELQRMAEALR